MERTGRGGMGLDIPGLVQMEHERRGLYSLLVSGHQNERRRFSERMLRYTSHIQPLLPTAQSTRPVHLFVVLKELPRLASLAFHFTLLYFRFLILSFVVNITESSRRAVFVSSALSLPTCLSMMHYYLDTSSIRQECLCAHVLAAYCPLAHSPPQEQCIGH